MNILGTLLIGFFAGIVARFLIPGKTPPKSLIMTTALGVLGAFLATYLGRYLGFYEIGEVAGFIGAVLGSIIVLLIYGALRKK